MQGRIRLGNMEKTEGSCGHCGFNTTAIAERLRLLDLDGTDTGEMGRTLQQSVIVPNIDAIIVRFTELLKEIGQFNVVVTEHSYLERLQGALRHYLFTLGVDYREREYFEERLHIGEVHHSIGVSQAQYHCAFRHLQDLLIEYIPRQIRDEPAAFDSLLRFVVKITALDMSLAVESFCDARVSVLQESLKSEQGEKERLRKLSVTDWLTDLYNHSFSRHSLDAALRRSLRENSRLCVIMADLDHFKTINDSYGHLVGDEVLRIVAARMISAARSGDQVARYGGEEFLFILQDTDLTEGEEVAERIRLRINSDTVQCHKKSMRVTMSLGLAQAREDDSVDDLIARADVALYTAKAAGRDCVRLEPQDDLVFGSPG